MIQWLRLHSESLRPKVPTLIRELDPTCRNQDKQIFKLIGRAGSHSEIFAYFNSPTPPTFMALTEAVNDTL